MVNSIKFSLWDHENVHLIRVACEHRLRELGAKHIVTFEDWLAWGPCDEEPETHFMLRQAFWKDAETVPIVSAHELLSKILASELGKNKGFLIVWTSDTWSDRLSLLWLMDASLRHLIDLMPIYIVDAPSSPSGKEFMKRNAPRSLAEWPLAQLRAESAHARQLSRREILYGHRLWRLYASRSPLAFDRQRQGGFVGMRGIFRVAKTYELLFPRLSHGALRLSLFDQTILSPLLESTASNWRSTSWIVSRLANDRVVAQLGSVRAVWERLFVWAHHSSALEFKYQHREDVQKMFSYAYRLSKIGRRILRSGLKNGSEAPVLFSGGCRVYGDSPWVLQRNRKKWTITKCLQK